MSPQPMRRDSLDLAYLARQTFGDAELQGELLALFEDQCLRLEPLLASSLNAVERADAAHTLRGAAGAVGALRVAKLSALMEAALDEGRRDETVARLVHSLGRAIADVRSAIALRSRLAA